MKVWLDGEVRDAAQARIPVTDHGLLYGDGVFEGLRVYDGGVFRLERHLARLAVSAKLIGIELPGGIEAMRAIVLDTAAAFGEPEAYVRLVVTRGDGPLGVDPTRCGPARPICIVAALELYPEDAIARGLSLVTSSLRRPAADVLDPRIKSLNYLNSVLAKQEARRQGADEALLLNAAGSIAEASVANLFTVRDGVLATPPVTDGALEGITRASVLELAREARVPTEIRSLGRADLMAADEVFLTGTGARMVPVRSLDGRALGRLGPGPVMARLLAAFEALVLREGTPVPGLAAR